MGYVCQHSFHLPCPLTNAISVTLDVGNIKDVEWNRAAFEMLVADEETKELVRALVENHCNAEKNTDLISGKGNGLFVLLHGYVPQFCGIPVTDYSQGTGNGQNAHSRNVRLLKDFHGETQIADTRTEWLRLPRNHYTGSLVETLEQKPRTWRK